MKKNYVDNRRIDRLGERSFTLRNKEIVKKLDAYCLLNDIKMTSYVEEAIKTKLTQDIKNMQDKGENTYE